jgi:hypothetical protein
VDDIRPVSTAMDATKTLHWEKESTADSAFMAKYQSVVGSLNYLATTSRLDIAFTISMFGRYSSNPNQDHVNLVVRIIAYSEGESYFRLILYCSFERCVCTRVLQTLGKLLALPHLQLPFVVVDAASSFLSKTLQSCPPCNDAIST